MTVQQMISTKNIQSALHFTTNRGLVGILAVEKLLSRDRLEDEQYLEYVLHVNSEQRPEAAADFDKQENWLDYVNLSISEVNVRFLTVSRNWHRNADVWWCILDFGAIIMTHRGVAFATTNNSYALCERNVGGAGLEALFEDRIPLKAGWEVQRGRRAAHLPTCEQAEILYPGAVSTKYLRRIYVGEDEHRDVVGGWLQEFEHKGVEVVVSRRKFEGSPN